eukprot:5791990-Karenia_brevis.AAC.1
MPSTPVYGPLIKQRFAACKPYARSLKKSVFNNSYLSYQHKANYARAYIFSRALFDAGSWGVLTSSELCMLHSGVMSVYRMWAFTTSSYASCSAFVIVHQISKCVAHPHMIDDLKFLALYVPRFEACNGWHI